MELYLNNGNKMWPNWWGIVSKIKLDKLANFDRNRSI